MREIVALFVLMLFDCSVDVGHSTSYEKNTGFLNGTGRGSRVRGEAFRDALLTEMKRGTIGLGLIAMESGKPIIQSASKEFDYEGRYYYWDNQQRRNNEELLCYMRIEELIKLSKKPVVPIISTGTNDTSDNSTQATSPEGPHVLLEKLQYRDGSRPIQITWACSEKQEERCCGMECCTESDLVQLGSSGALTSLIIIAVILCCCCGCCYACKECRTMSQARRDRQLMGGVGSTNTIQYARPPSAAGPYGQNQLWQPPRPTGNLALANYPRQEYPKPKSREDHHSPPDKEDKAAKDKSAEKLDKKSPPEKDEKKEDADQKSEEKKSAEKHSGEPVEE